MDTSPKSSPSRHAFAGVLLLLLLLGGCYVLGEWMFCRFYVDVGYMAIITAKDGTDLPPGQILAKPGQKGVLEEPLGEGRHFLNPITHDWKIVPAVRIPAGKVGVVTSKVGTELPQGEFLADAGQKGVWRRVLGPGLYRLNPEGYHVQQYDAINIPIGYVGVVTSLSGDKAPEGKFAGVNQKGVRQDVLQPGLYYVNPNAHKVDVLEVGLNQVSLTGKEGGQIVTKSKVEMQNAAMEELASNVLATQQERRKDYLEQQAQAAPQRLADKKTAAAKPAAPPRAGQKPRGSDDSVATFGLAQFVEFPSRDGFEIRLDMTVEFELLPEKISELFLRYGDLPAVVDKIIMPQIQSVSRLKGSTYRAQDFIVGEGREKFQNELKESLAAVLKEKDIVVHNSLIRHVEVPEQILAPIQQASIAIEQNLTNIARQATARKQAELNTVETLVDQRRQEVLQETEKLVAETKATQEKEVAEIQAEADKKVALIAQDTASVRAGITRTLGEARAKVVTLVEGEKARGFELKVKAIGDPATYNLLAFSETLNPNVTLQIIHAGPGTLWTDLKNAGFGELGGARLLTTPTAGSPGLVPAAK